MKSTHVPIGPTLAHCLNVVIYRWMQFISQSLRVLSMSFPLSGSSGDGHYKWLPLCVWRDNGLHLQHRLAQAGPDYQGLDPPQAEQPP